MDKYGIYPGMFDNLDTVAAVHHAWLERRTYIPRAADDYQARGRLAAIAAIRVDNIRNGR